MGKKPSPAVHILQVRVPTITLTCPITTMFLYSMFNQLYGSKNDCDPMEYILTLNLLG